MNVLAPRAAKFHVGSWYQEQLSGSAPIDVLDGALSVRTAIIGGGLAGLSTALGLAERGESDLVLFERGRAGEGASGRNGGFVFAGYSLDAEALVRRVGIEAARRMHGWTRSAVATIDARCRAWSVPASRQGVVLADWFHDPAALRRHRDRMSEALQFELEWIAPEDLPYWVQSARYGAGLHEPGSLHLNPLAYVCGMVEAVRAAHGRVCEYQGVLKLWRDGDGWLLRTRQGRVRAERVVLATGGYDATLRPRWQRSVQPIGTYIAVTEPLGDQLDSMIPGGVAVYDTRFAFDYYRPLPDSRLLWGGRISVADRDPALIRRLLRRDMLRVFPALADADFDYAWGGWMSYARHQMPLLGEVEPGLWLALGFGGHGLAPTTLAGDVLAESIMGDRSRLGLFEQFPPRWAGGLVGRGAAQALYWWKQLRDARRDRRRTAASSI